jgi:hypothetical protein
MRILFDHGTPAPLRRALVGHDVETAYEKDWADLSNGDLLKAAEETFDLLIKTDQSLRYQQNLSGRQLAILVLPTTSWPDLRRHLSQIQAAVASMRPGGFLEMTFHI